MEPTLASPTRAGNETANLHGGSRPAQSFAPCPTSSDRARGRVFHDDFSRASAPSPIPLREGLSSLLTPNVQRGQPPPGASGDLTFRKLIPAVYNIAADLPMALSVVGFARREKTDAQFREELEEAARTFPAGGERRAVGELRERRRSPRSEFGNLEGYALLTKLDALDVERGRREPANSTSC